MAHQVGSGLTNSAVWQKRNQRHGTKPLKNWLQRSKSGTIPEKRLKPTLTGDANFNAIYETSRRKNFRPRTLIPKLKIQLEFLSELHDRDFAAGYAGVFLVGSLEKKSARHHGIHLTMDFSAKEAYSCTGYKRAILNTDKPNPFFIQTPHNLIADGCKRIVTYWRYKDILKENC
jgi:hypothetical protein